MEPQRVIHILGAPCDAGSSRPGCLMGPAAIRTAGLVSILRDLGHEVVDRGDASPDPLPEMVHPNSAIQRLNDVAGWASTLQRQAAEMAGGSDLPIFLGGDHSISAGTIAGVAAHHASEGRPVFVLWLDAHPDLHRLSTTSSGHLHGTPMAYCLGLEGFEGRYPALPAPLSADRICLMGLRSVDPSEADLICSLGLEVHDMRAIDERGVVRPLSAFLERVRAAGGALHVSLDVDFLDPDIAPAVGTTVPGGATFREAHLIMELLHDSGLVTSLDIVELNPFSRSSRAHGDLDGRSECQPAWSQGAGPPHKRGLTTNLSPTLSFGRTTP